MNVNARSGTGARRRPSPRIQWLGVSQMDKPEQSDNAEIMLDLLTAIERDSELTQRSLAQDLGIALGLANAYLKRCVSKGLIKVRQAPLNRYAYYLTPSGFREKSRLTAEYLAVSFNLFRDARRQYAELFAACAARSLRHLALVGDGELAEIAALSATEAQVEIVCVIDRRSRRQHCAGRPVVPDLVAAQALCQGQGGLQAFVATDMNAPQAVFEWASALALRSGLPDGRVFAPKILRIRFDAEAEPVAEAAQ